MFKKIIISLFLFFFFYKPVFADSKFENSYKITYQVTASGLANVTEQITITNKSSDYYPTEQTFSYLAYNLGNIKAYDEQGQFDPEVKKEGNSTTVRVLFRTKNVGIGKKTEFTLKYQTSDIATLNGEVWQILIPGIKNLDLYDNFLLELQLPDNFPEIQYASIEPATRWIWEKQEIQNKGIFLIFGQKQFYDIKLHYSLKNSGITSILDSITIPPDTNYQGVALSSISIKPEYSERDEDGNWIFWFLLGPQKTIDINANLIVSLRFNPDHDILLDKNQIKTYTASQHYWDYEKFSSLSSKINNLKTIKEIYNFTVNNLTYNFNRLNKPSERFTASEALKNPGNSICTDFTNIFIALARKNGIPAREVDGFGQTQNNEIQPVSLEKDILHAWPEYYDFEKKTWIMVDPTWGATTNGIDFFNKLDLNHIAFVIKGASSETPYPAGSFKTDDLTKKDVQVIFSNSAAWEKEIKREKTVDVSYDKEGNLISGLNHEIKITIQNKSNVTLKNTEILIRINNQIIEKHVDNLIPFEKYELKINLPKTQIWQKKDILISTTISHKSFTKKITLLPIYLYGDNLWFFVGGGGLVLISLLMIIFIGIKTVKNKHDA